MKIKMNLQYFLLVMFSIAGITSQAQRKIILPDGNSALIYQAKPDRQRKFFYTAENRKCIMWEMKTGRQMHTFIHYGGSDGPDGIDISPDGSRLIIAGNGSLSMFNTATGEQVSTPRMESSIKTIMYSTDGTELYSSNKGLDIIDANTMKVKAHINGSVGTAAKMWLLPGNKVLLADALKFEVYEPDGRRVSSSYPLPADPKYRMFTFLPLKQLLVCYGRDTPIDFYDINTGAKKGTLKGVVFDEDAVVPSENTNEILIGGTEVSEGIYSLDLYSTETFKPVSHYTNTTVEKYNNPRMGYFDGKAKKALLVNSTKVIDYNLVSKKRELVFEGVVANLGSDVFSAIQYNYSNGRLHLGTDDRNVKSIDLYRMVPVLHNDIKIMPKGLSVSSTGDTVAIFEESRLVVKNMVTNKTIGVPAPVKGVGFLYRSAFFFSSDGKSFFYPFDGDEIITLMKVNTATGAKSAVFSVKGLGQVTTHPDNTMMAGFESDYQLNTAGVWDITTGRRLFTAAMPTDGNYDSQYASLSYDKKRVMVVKDKYIKIYDIASGGVLLDKMMNDYIPKDGVYAANNNLSLFLTGNRNGNVEVFNEEGRLMYKIKAHSAAVRKIVFSPDDKLFYTISEDNTVKVWETATGRFIGVLYMFKDSNDFVFMDNEGRFDGTEAGIKKIYYLFNKKIMPLDALFEVYYTPNLYQRTVNKEVFAVIDVNIKQAPRVKVTYASATRNLEVDEDMPSYQNTTGAADITVTASSENDRVDEVRLFHNGKIVTLTTRNLIVEDDNRPNTAVKKYSLNLLPGINSIRAVALNSQRTESDPDEILVTYTTKTAVPLLAKPIGSTGALATVDKSATMYLVVVGINAYKNPSMSLNYALADASSFKDQMEKDAKTVITNVITYFVKDNEADKAGIINAFAEVKKNAKAQDLFVFYYAGHGVIGKDKEFYLVPNDVSNLSNVQAELLQKGIPSQMLQQYAIDIQAQKQLFILDACQSAGAFEKLLSDNGNQQKSLAVVARSTGTHWMAASGAQQFANEFSSLGHGVFTYVLLEALKGKALENKMVTVNGLKGYLQVKVPELMKKYNGAAQYPASYGTGNDFPVQSVK